MWSWRRQNLARLIIHRRFKSLKLDVIILLATKRLDKLHILHENGLDKRLGKLPSILCIVGCKELELIASNLMKPPSRLWLILAFLFFVISCLGLKRYLCRLVWRHDSFISLVVEGHLLLLFINNLVILETAHRKLSQWRSNHCSHL